MNKKEWDQTSSLKERFCLPNPNDSAQVIYRHLALLESMRRALKMGDNSAYISWGDDPDTAAVNYINEFVQHPAEVLARQRSEGNADPLSVREGTYGLAESPIDPLQRLNLGLRFTLKNIPNDAFPELITDPYSPSPYREMGHSLHSLGFRSASHSIDYWSPSTTNIDALVSLYSLIHSMGLIRFFNYDPKRGTVRYQPRYCLSMTYENVFDVFKVPQEFKIGQHLIELAGYATQADPYLIQPFADRLINTAAASPNRAAKEFRDFMADPVNFVLSNLSTIGRYNLANFLSYYDHEYHDLYAHYGVTSLLNFPQSEHLGRVFLEDSYLVWTCMSGLNWDRNRQVYIGKELRNPYIKKYLAFLIEAGKKLEMIAMAIPQAAKFPLTYNFFKGDWTVASSGINRTLNELNYVATREGPYRTYALENLHDHPLMTGFTERMKAALLTHIAFRNVRENIRGTSSKQYPEHTLTQVTIGGQQYLSPSHAVRAYIESIRYDFREARLEVYTAFSRDLARLQKGEITPSTFVNLWQPSDNDRFSSKDTFLKACMSFNL